jgi:hypothetical protein
VSGAASGDTTSAGTLRQRVAVPSYFYPCHNASAWQPDSPCDWDRLIASHPPVDVAIINPNSGPGVAPDPNYVAQMARGGAAGVTMLGYVHTTYGERNLSAVCGDVARYATWYAVDGIFVDEVSADCALLPYYAAVIDCVQGSVGGGAATIILNPGQSVPACFNATLNGTSGDGGNATVAIVNYEGAFTDYVGWSPLPWVNTTAPASWWHIVHNASGALMQHAAAITLSKARGAGWVYVTDQTMPNPYAALPGIIYLDDVVRWASGNI